MIEYDFHIALSNWEREEDRAILRFPESAVLFLRHNESSPDRLKVKLIMPDGSEADYTVPVVKVQQYSKEEIFDKNLLFFVPYYILRFEKDMERMNKDDEELKKLIDDYEDIYSRLCSLGSRNAIDYGYLHDLVSLTAKLIEVVARDNEHVKQEVIKMGGGKVLEMESDKILERGIQQGISQGISDTIISILGKYGVVSEELKSAIYTENDIDKLRGWVMLSTNVSSIEEFTEKM